ncbi:MAG: hypothetical protein JNM72_09715 [Deltaproteobacteria bacterium]|nr:hypothetical protein [Deltaproteobacteria bacterium]
MRENLGLLLALLVILLVGVVGYRALFGPQGPELVVLDAVGQAVRVRAAEGAVPLRVGDALAVDDQLMVGETGVLRVGIGEGSELSLQANSALRLTAVTDDGVRVELEGGAVSARVRAGAPSLGLRARGRELQLASGEVNAGLADDGRLTVEVLAGELALSGVDGQATLAAGRRLDLADGQAPVAAPITEALQIQVRGPSTIGEDGAVSVIAQTQPYALVELSGAGATVQVVAGPDGIARLPAVIVPRGGATVALRARDALGREASVTHRFEAPAGPRLMGTAVQWAP